MQALRSMHYGVLYLFCWMNDLPREQICYNVTKDGNTKAKLQG